MDDLKFKQLMIADEGERMNLYVDTKGKTGIGIGRNLTDNGIRKIESDFMFANDLADAKLQLNRNVSWWVLMSDNRQMVFANMVMNMGIGDFLTFHKMLSAAKSGDWMEAGAQILDSKAARDAPARYMRLAQLMEKG